MIVQVTPMYKTINQDLFRSLLRYWSSLRTRATVHDWLSRFWKSAIFPVVSPTRVLSITNQCSGHTSQEFWTAQVNFICPRTGFSPWLGIYNIYIYLSLYVINMSTQIQLWVEEFVSSRFKPYSAVVPGLFWYIFLTAQFAEQVQEMRISSQEDQHTHTDIYIYTYTPWEPLKPSFLGLSAHISRAEKRSFFMGFGVQRHIHGETWCVCGLFHPSSHKVKNSSQDKDHQAGPDSGTCVLCMYYKAHSE